MKLAIVSVGLIIAMGAVAWGMHWIDFGAIITGVNPVTSQKQKKDGNNEDNASKSECLQMVRAAYHNVAEVGKNGRITRVRYSVSSTATVMGKITTTKANIELLVAENRVQMTGGPMEIWQDEKVKITLIPNRRLLYIGDTDPRRFKQAQSPLALAFQDSLIALSQIESCIEKKETNGEVVKQVKLRLPEPLQTQAQLSDINITINPSEEMVQHVQLQYLPSSQIKEMEMTIDSIETNYQTNLFDQTILQKFFDEQGKIRSLYSEYKIIDVRVRKAVVDNGKQ